MNIARISEVERQARLAVLLTDGIGRRLFIDLMERSGSAKELLSLGVQEWRHWGLSDQVLQGLANPAWHLADNQLAWQVKETHHYLLFWDEIDYPKNLLRIDDIPPILWVRGRVECLYEPQLAIVGSRHATRAGMDTAFQFARELARDGLTITSGLAGGIDTAAHEGALAHTTGTTVAVMGTGIDLMYPSRNKELAVKIMQHGAIISEFPLGAKAQSWHFPQRNRLISGLSLGTLNVEAT